jgi:macrolide transport system ATP-binding/permease protein
MLGTARSTMHSTDPELAFIQPQSLEEFVDRSPAVFLRRYPFYLIGSFASLALILATIGLYGLISYSVLQRTREIGIRMALGAQRPDILKLVIRQGVIAAVTGVAIGLVGGVVLTRVMASLLYGVVRLIGLSLYGFRYCCCWLLWPRRTFLPTGPPWSIPWSPCGTNNW